MSDDRPDESSSDSESPREQSGAADDHPLIVSSEELLQGRRELWIEHENEIYRLRVTSKGRLYLTK
jgi:hemin uptake protein HemP